jgi:hypothetical protein
VRIAFLLHDVVLGCIAGGALYVVDHHRLLDEARFVQRTVQRAGQGVQSAACRTGSHHFDAAGREFGGGGRGPRDQR